uniref:Ovule protein n=1 Tax=Brugia timori TaxID=42155 RepID=A0A0R3R537_9BILA
LSRNSDEIIRHLAFLALPVPHSFLIKNSQGAKRERGLKGSYAGAGDLGDSCDWLHPGTA